MKCPIKSLKSWKDLVAVQSEELSYYLWDKYDGEVPEEYYTKKSDATNNIGIRPGVSELFESNHELSSIGSPQLYSKYLDTIFPDSKVKDIVYHGSKSKFEKFDKSKLGSNTNPNKEFSQFNDSYLGFHFTSDPEYYRGRSEFGSKYEKNLNEYIAILNIENPKDIADKDEFSQNNIQFIKENDVKNNDSIIYDYLSTVDFSSGEKINKYTNNYVVFDPEQIHILGSKQDVEEFKEFVRQSDTTSPEAKESVSEGLKTSGDKYFQVSNSLSKLNSNDIKELQSTAEHQLLNEDDSDLYNKVGKSYVFLSNSDAERLNEILAKNNGYPKEFKVTKKITKYDRSEENPLGFNGYNEYVDFYYIKSNNNKKSNLYDIVNKETGEVIATKVRLLSISKDAKSEISSRYGLEYTPTKIFNANRSIAFVLYREKPSKAKYIAQAKKYVYDAIKFTKKEDGIQINLNKIEELLNSFPEDMWEYINTTYSPEDSTNINASISLQRRIKFELPKLGLLNSLENITGIKLQGQSFKNYDRSNVLQKIFEHSKIDGSWGSTITIDYSRMTRRELSASISYYLKSKKYFKESSENENVRKYAEHRNIDYNELKELVFGDIDNAINNISFNETGNSNEMEVSKWRNNIKNYDWQSVELFSKPYDDYIKIAKNRITDKFKDKNLSNGISHLDYFFSGSFNWLNINFNNISGKYYLSDMNSDTNVGVKKETKGILNQFDINTYTKPIPNKHFLKEEEVFNRLAAILHEPFHALHALSYGTKEELELRKSFDNLYKTDFGKEMLNQVFEFNYNNMKISYDTLYKEFTAFATQLILFPKEWIHDTDLRSNDIFEFIEKIQTLQDKTYKEIERHYEKIGEIEKVITEEEKIKLTFLQKLYNYLISSLNKVIPLSKQFFNIIEDSRFVSKTVIEDVFGTVEKEITKTLELPKEIKKSKDEFLIAMDELKSSINSLMQIDSTLFNSDNVKKFFNSNKYNQDNNHVYQRSNEVQYKLKAVDILLSDKAKQIFAKGEKAKWDLNKILTELAVPKEQKQLLLDLGIKDREQLAVELASKYSYSVEINTAKDEFISNEYNPETDQFEDRNYGTKNTEYYYNLTVPGGTNYTENKIETPLITPSIQGHPEWVKKDGTDKGIGWFRADEKATKEESIFRGFLGESSMDKADIDDLKEDLFDGKITEEQFTKLTGLYRPKLEQSSTKTRRILEVQSDLFQKGRDRSDLIGKNYIVNARGNYESFKIDDTLYFHENATNKYYKGSDAMRLFDGDIEITKEEYDHAFESVINITNQEDFTQNQFLQLLNKDNNWVTFFIKSIVQDSAKKGYEKVLFPKGETAARIEGHETLSNEIDSINNELESLNENNIIVGKQGDYRIVDKNGNLVLGDIKKELVEERRLSKIKQLEQRKTELKSQGIEKLKPIEGFYEIKVGNILDKIFGKDNVKTITDEYGNQWREITIDESRDLSDILLQKLFDESDIKLNKSQLESLQKFADELSSRFGTKFELISQEEARAKFKGYIDEAGIYDPDTKTAYLVKGVATKDTAIHEIFTHPFLESIKGSDLYNKLLEEAIATKGIKEFVDKAYSEYSQDIRNDEYIARAIDLIVNRKESSPKLMDLVYKFFTKMANFINKLFNKELVKVQSINPNITLEQLSNYALYGRDRLAIDQITGINSLDDIMSILTNKSALEAFKISENTMSIEQFLKSVGIKDSMISDIADYYYESRPETYQQFVTGIHDTILSGKTVYFQRSNPEHHSTPETLAIAIKEKQLRGLRARLRVLEVRGTSTKEQISELETVIKTIDELEADKSSLEFIKYSKQKLNEAAKYLLTFETQRANGERINETNLMSLYQDFLKLFEGSLSEMDMAERTNGAIFSSLDDEMKNTAKEELNALKTSYSNLLARFDILARYEFENMLGEISDRVNFTSKDEMLKDVYSIKSDVAFLKNKWLGLYVLSAERSSIPQLRALDKVISDIEEEIERKVDETGLIDELKSAIRNLSKTRTFSYSEFREKGEDGKDTGYLVSPLKWGMYSIKKRAFISKLNKKYNVDPKIGKPTNNEDFIAYNTELNKFLSENVERRLDNSYYEAKSKLSMHASIAMDYADDVLRKFEHQFLNEYGVPDTSKMSSKQKEVWLRLKKEKRDLASEYDSLGNIKVGQELETAKEIQAFREKFNGKLEFKQRNDVFEKVKEEKRKSLSKVEFDKWEKNNTVTRANQEFYDELAKLERADYGARYEELMDRARAIEKRYRDPLTGDIDVDLMDSIYDSNGISVKQSLDELYTAAGIEKRNYKELHKVSPTKGFDKLAKFEITDAGNALKSRMQAMYDSGDPELMKEALAMREANFDLIEFVGWVPKRYYQKIVPVQKKHIETVPNAIWNDIDEESALYNKNYKEDLAQNNFHPKLSIYDNKKEYDKLISDENKKKLYDTLLKIYEHGYSKFSYLTTEDKYRLPQIEGSFLRSVSARSGLFPKIKEAFRQIFAVQEDEDGYGDLGLSQYRADGSRLRLARTKYIQHIDNPAAISKNLGEIYSLFLIEAIRFQEVSKAEGKINLFQHAFSKTSVNPEDDSEQLVKAGETNLIKKAEDLINRNVYDEKKQIGTIKVPGTNYKISLTKPLFGMLQYAGAFINLSLNKFAIWGNFSSAENNLLIEAHIGMDISKLDLLKSSGIVATELHNAIADIGASTVRCKQTLINNFYGILGETNRNLVGKGSNNIAGDISDLILFGGYSAGDYVVKSKMLDAMLLGFRYDPNEKKFYQREEYASEFYPNDREAGYKVFDSLKVSIYDILENKDGKIVVKDEYKDAYTNNLHSKIKSRADNLAARLDGILTRNSKSSLFSSAVGSAIMLNRQWILNVWMNLFGSGVYSFKEQRDVEGMYVTLAKYMIDNNHNNIAFVKNIGRLVSGKERELIERNQLTAKERDAIRRIQAQFASIVILSILASLMFRFSDDDEDSLFYTLGTMLLRTGTEISASVIPTDTWGFVQSPTAAKPLMDQFGELYDLTLSGSLKDEVRSGPYKNESKLQQTLTKISPFKHLKEDWISPDIRKKKTYLEDQSSLVYPIVNSLIGIPKEERKKKQKMQADSYFDSEEWFDDKKK